SVPVRDGLLLLPTLGLARIGAPDDLGFAMIRRSEGGTKLVGRDGHATVPDDPSSDGPGWQGMRRLASSAGDRRIEIEVDDLDPQRDGFGQPLARRLDSDRFARWQRTLDEAWALLARDHPDRAEALAVGLTSLVPVEAPPDLIVSGTTRDGFGGVAMSMPA